MKIKTNFDEKSLYCIYSKELIEIGEKYVEVINPEDADDIKTYKLENAPSENEADEPYVG